MSENSLGEFEEMVLLGILHEGSQAFALEVRREMEARAGRKVSRGAFYTTLERMQGKGLVSWEASRPQGSRGSGTHRLFSVTPAGLEALRQTKRALVARWTQLEKALEEL